MTKIIHGKVHGRTIELNEDLGVADGQGTALLVYHYDLAAGQFHLLEGYAVGDRPAAITVADLNGDGAPDLLVANAGSNDVSVLLGSTAAGVWTATPSQRLSSGGEGPVTVAAAPSRAVIAASVRLYSTFTPVVFVKRYSTALG